MTASRLLRLLTLAGAALPLLFAAAIGQESLPWNAPQDGGGQGYGSQSYGSGIDANGPGDYDVRSYRTQESGSRGSSPNDQTYGSRGGYGQSGASAYSAGESANTYAPPRDTYGQGQGYAATGSDNGYAAGTEGYPQQSGGYASERNDAYAPSGSGYAANRNDAYSPSGGGYSGGGYAAGQGDAYSPGGSSGDAYVPPQTHARNDSFTEPGEPAGGGGGAGYGAPYAPPPAEGSAPPPYRDGPPPREGGYYEQGEIISEGHKFFGAISQGLASAVEYAFKSEGRPNGYILGEDAGGAFVLGLRYGEGTLYTKDAGDHKVFWQGPTLGYDAGAEGSKTMVLVYNLRDPSEIYNRFGGVQGAAYLVGGVSVQFQTYGDVKLALIRSGVGLRLGANVGYLKYTRTPTWNPL
jgi:hypothetical protein